jgi:uncharacterized pyridoxal phosphate-containing UPF0001 family protein
MKINTNVLDHFAGKKSKLLVVTKYFAPAQTADIIEQLRDHSSVIGFGENRPNDLLDKKIDRSLCHFIGNIQSRQIAVIAAHCAVVHSLSSAKHAQKFLEQALVPDFFVQVNVSAETIKGGIDVMAVMDFLGSLPAGISVRGISAIGAYTDNPVVKKQEFEILLALCRTLETNRDKWVHLNLPPVLQISAGTSIDYLVALEYDIDLIRVGRGLFCS